MYEHLQFYHQWATELYNATISIANIESDKLAWADTQNSSKCWIFADILMLNFTQDSDDEFLNVFPPQEAERELHVPEVRPSSSAVCSVLCL